MQMDSNARRWNGERERPELRSRYLRNDEVFAFKMMKC